MIKMKNIITLLLLSISSIAFSCTSFVIKDEKQLVFGRNLDWFSDDGIVVVNKRNVNKTSLVFPPEKPIEWFSKYGSVTFNQFGKEFPFGGINEKGLVVEVMIVKGEYPRFDNRPAINESQWVQYQLDNCETIEDVIKTDKFLRISEISRNIHFLICDKYGNSAVIEFTKNGIVVHKGIDLPFAVLENNTYEKSLYNYENNKSCRFLTTTKLVKLYNSKDNTNIINYSFDILNKVKLDGSWSIVYDIKNMQIHFKTASNQLVRKIDINKFDFSCSSSSLIYNLEAKDEFSINEFFTPFSTEVNTKIIKTAFKTNSLNFPESILNRIYAYNSECTCIVD